METLKKLHENVAIMLPENGLEQKLQQAEKENRKLKIKLGFDPTAPDLHLGHAVVLKKMKQFQELGHQIIIVVGSFTARIGDPTGKNKSRKPLNLEEVKHNATTYIKQLSKIIEVDQAEIVFNSDWLDNLPFSEALQLISKVTVAQLMQRKDFNKRFTENTPIAMHELIYPILQGFDSVQLECDIEMGGTDQLFNCTMGRQLQESHNLAPQIVMCMPLLRGIDGTEKMSKSQNNTIGLTDDPNTMFGKTMSIPDVLIEEFLNLATDFSIEERQQINQQLIEGENPMNVKKRIAKNIIKQFHDEQAATDAETFFINQFQNKKFEDKSFKQVVITTLNLQSNALTTVALCKIFKENLSNTAIRRLIEDGAVQINNEKIKEPYQMIEIAKNLKIKIGKRDFYELQ
ncbi:MULTISPECIES: tyrosine--tRNA ligase [Flavobacterium]|uniref:Tyrosine--tRNA ligase n=1 Tax=Flavobacterium jumunjinense TaxID=998845 RepID=A0ABV5GSY0_9FLAO|nr:MULTISPECIES: tyrosine--tRNA ligase [Flavobacterium]